MQGFSFNERYCNQIRDKVLSQKHASRKNHLYAPDHIFLRGGGAGGDIVDEYLSVDCSWFMPGLADNILSEMSRVTL